GVRSLNVDGSGAATGMLRWMPATRSGSASPIDAVTIAPQSPPCAPYRSYPRRAMSSVHARAIRSMFQPVPAGLSPKPYQGREGKALRPVVDRLGLGPTGAVQPVAEVRQLIIGGLDAERGDLGDGPRVCLGPAALG